MSAVATAPQVHLLFQSIATITKLPTEGMWEILEFVHPADYLRQGICTCPFSDPRSVEIIKRSVAECFRRIFREKISLEKAHRVTDKLMCEYFPTGIAFGLPCEGSIPPEYFVPLDKRPLGIEEVRCMRKHLVYSSNCLFPEEYLPDIQQAGLITFPTEQRARLFARATLPQFNTPGGAGPSCVYLEITHCIDCANEENASYFLRLSYVGTPNFSPLSILCGNTSSLLKEVTENSSGLHNILKYIPLALPPSSIPTETSTKTVDASAPIALRGKTTESPVELKARVSCCNKLLNAGWNFLKKVSTLWQSKVKAN